MGKKAPKAPDPKETAAAQTGTNIGTAIANNTLGNVNQVTPYGNMTYAQTGTTKWTDPNSGKVYDLPTYTSTQTLSADGQKIFNSQQQADINLANLASEQSGRLGGLLSAPLSLSNEATEARLAELGRARLDPALAQRRTAKETQLANQGIQVGSAAYDRAMGLVDQGENDAYNQLFLTGRQQAISEAITERQTPINEILALSSGTQLQSPNWVNTNQAQIGTPDIAGMTYQKYQADMDAYNNKQKTLGGLFSTIATISDRRIKSNITKIGNIGPIPLVTFNYLFDPVGMKPRTGVIAQDVQKVLPEAVQESNGLLTVDYRMVKEWAKENNFETDLMKEMVA